MTVRLALGIESARIVEAGGVEVTRGIEALEAVSLADLDAMPLEILLPQLLSGQGREAAAT